MRKMQLLEVSSNIMQFYFYFLRAILQLTMRNRIYSPYRNISRPCPSFYIAAFGLLTSVSSINIVLLYPNVFRQ